MNCHASEFDPQIFVFFLWYIKMNKIQQAILDKTVFCCPTYLKWIISYHNGKGENFAWKQQFWLLSRCVNLLTFVLC